MSILLLFIMIVLISALGSTPPGLINLMVMKRSISAGRKAGVFTALGTVIPEFVYTYIAVYGYLAISESETIEHNLQIAGAIVFLSLSAFYFFQASEEPFSSVNRGASKKYFASFRRGFLTASINLLVIPFWAFIAVSLHSYGYEFQSQSEMITFALGSALGALVMFLLYARLGHLIVHRMEKMVRYTNQFLALVFLILGMYQLVRLY